jgi:uncharacterized membrane-anchored protein YhcB (DUF1043 family)
MNLIIGLLVGFVIGYIIGEIQVSKFKEESKNLQEDFKNFINNMEKSDDEYNE